MSTKKILAAGGVAFALLATACGKGPAVSTYSPGSAYSPQPSSSPAGVFSPGQGLPGSALGGQTSSPPPQAAGVSSPSAAVQGTVQDPKHGSSGQPIALSFGYVVGYPLYAFPSGLASVAWADDGGNTLSFGVNHLFKGTQKTGEDGLSLVFTLSNPERSFTSGDGTCTVTVSTLEKHALKGRFTCSGVKSPTGQTLNAQGTFGSRLNVGV